MTIRLRPTSQLISAERRDRSGGLMVRDAALRDVAPHHEGLNRAANHDLILRSAHLRASRRMDGKLGVANVKSTPPAHTYTSTIVQFVTSRCSARRFAPDLPRPEQPRKAVKRPYSAWRPCCLYRVRCWNCPQSRQCIGSRELAMMSAATRAFSPSPHCKLFTTPRRKMCRAS